MKKFTSFCQVFKEMHTNLANCPLYHLETCTQSRKCFFSHNIFFFPSASTQCSDKENANKGICSMTGVRNLNSLDNKQHWLVDKGPAISMWHTDGQTQTHCNIIYHNMQQLCTCCTKHKNMLIELVHSRTEMNWKEKAQRHAKRLESVTKIYPYKNYTK